MLWLGSRETGEGVSGDRLGREGWVQQKGETR